MIPTNTPTRTTRFAGALLARRAPGRAIRPSFKLRPLQESIVVTRNEAFPSKYWKASDLSPRGKVFKIAKLQLERVGLDQEEKYVLFFKGEDKQLILNITNWDAIAEFCGADSDTWTGRDIVL